MSTFGETGAGTTTTAADFADKAAVTTVTITELALVSKLTMRLSNQGAGHVACQGYAVIYTDNSAVPHALYATGSAVDISDNVAMGEIDFAFAKAVLMEPGTYHIGVIFDDDADGVALRYLAGGREDTHADVPPPLELWGTTSATANTYCCYGTYTAITYTRPLAADTEILVTTRARVPIGRVPARVRWTQVLDGPDRLDSVTMPKWFLKQNGVRVSRPELAKYGWCIKFAGNWYTLGRVTSDNETTVTFAGNSLEASELKRSISSTGRASFLRTAELPTDIMNDLLLGTGPIEVDQPGFEGDTTYPFTTTHWVGEAIVSAAEINVESDVVWSAGLGQAWGYNMSAPYLWYDRAAEKADSLMVALVNYCPAEDDSSSASSYRWAGFGTATLFPAGKGAKYRLSADMSITFWTFDLNPAVWSPASELDVWNEAIAEGCEVNAEFWWYASDQTTVIGRDIYPFTKPNLLTRARQYWPSETEYVTAKGDYLRVVFSVYVPIGVYVATAGERARTRRQFYMDDVELDGLDLSEPSDWTYYGNPMNVRETDILHTDDDWIEFGTWTVGASDISSTVRGNQLAYIITGDTCDIHFTAGGAGALCDIYVDGAAVESAYDVSAACTYAIAGLDNTVEHIVKLRVNAVKVAVGKLVVSPMRRITVNWPDMRTSECLDDLVNVVGGEILTDTENKRLYHLSAVGQDLLAENILDLRRGSNLLSCDITAQRSEIVNHLLYLGYGSGSTRLRLTVTGQGVNEDGATSVAAYDVQWGKYENSDCQDFYLGRQEAQALVNEWQWPATEYRLTCPDETAAYICAGDTVRIYWDADPDDIINVSVRVLEVTRDNEGGAASLVVGTRVSQLPDRLAATARKIDSVSRNL